MMRLRDAAVLAATKLRVHRIRTGFAVGISGLLFGLMMFAIMVAQGVFDSVDRFSGEGLNDRTILQITRQGGMGSFNAYDQRDDPEFIAEVRAAHADLVQRKQAAAKKYGIAYDPATEDPSPIGIDPDTKQPAITDSGLGSPVVEKIASAKYAAEYKPFDITDYLKPYKSAANLGRSEIVTPADGNLTYMQDGKEGIESGRQRAPKGLIASDGDRGLTVLNGSLTRPFISNTAFDPSKGDIPVVVPYSDAEKLLGLKKLDAKATNEQKLERLAEVRRRIGEVTASFCYRNQASQVLLATAVAQQRDIARGQADKDYAKPHLVYTVPSDDTCGAVTVASDTRTAAEKLRDTNKELYEKEIGAYQGDPAQQRITVRGVGITGDTSSTSAWSIGSMISGLLGSNLGYGSWAVPGDLLAKVPAADRPDAVFAPTKREATATGFYMYESYLVEFGDQTEARKLLEKNGGLFGGYGNSGVAATPFGSSVLFVDEFKQFFVQAMLWIFAVIGTIALIILGTIIGRTVADGRRESAVFRAIGAKRSDIGLIYGTYALLLSLRVVVFALVLGIVCGLLIQVLYGRDATLGAQLAYAASDTSLQFGLFSLGSWYLPLLALAIIAVGLLGAIIPILLGARRNPIRDMRDDT